MGACEGCGGVRRGVADRRGALDRALLPDSTAAHPRLPHVSSHGNLSCLGERGADDKCAPYGAKYASTQNQGYMLTVRVSILSGGCSVLSCITLIV